MHPVLLDWNWEMIVWSYYLQCRYIATEINAALHTHTHSFLGAYWIAMKRWETNVCCSITLIVPNSSTLTLISLSAKTFFPSALDQSFAFFLSSLPPFLPLLQIIWFGLLECEEVFEQVRLAIISSQALGFQFLRHSTWFIKYSYSYCIFNNVFLVGQILGIKEVILMLPKLP